MNPVVSVEELVAAPPGPGITAHFMDRPQAAETGQTWALCVAGWVLGSPARAVSVEVVASGKVVKTTPVVLVRPGVAQRFPELGRGPSGYSTTVGVLGLPARCRLDVVAVLAEGARVPLGHFVVRHAPLPRCLSSYRPLMITSLGRMGTTWLMRLLSAHPAIVAQRSYPYEVAVGRFWAHQLGVLSAPADYETSGSPDTFATDTAKVGHNPFYGPMVRDSPEIEHWLGRNHVEGLARFCRESIDGFYHEVARCQGQDPEGYFAEKFLPDHTPVLMWDLYPDGRELILVRDMRDVVCSMLAFNAKRANQSFGREHAVDDADFVRNLARDVDVLVASWGDRAQRAQLVHYEELVREPRRVLADILRYLDLDHGEGAVDVMIDSAATDTADLQAHRTSSGPEASIGRWRHDLEPELAQLCQGVMADALGALGYAGAAA